MGTSILISYNPTSLANQPWVKYFGHTKCACKNEQVLLTSLLSGHSLLDHQYHLTSCIAAVQELPLYCRMGTVDPDNYDICMYIHVCVCMHACLYPLFLYCLYVSVSFHISHALVNLISSTHQLKFSMPSTNISGAHTLSHSITAD